MTARPWVWIDPQVILTIHVEQLTEHGGEEGIRDPGLLDSALARPLNLAAYGNPGVAELTAAYGFGIARNHPFVDANFRKASLVLRFCPVGKLIPPTPSTQTTDPKPAGA